MNSINVTRSSMPSFDEYAEEIKGLWDSRWLTNSGVKHQELEINMKEYLQVPNVTFFSNGHLALEAIIDSMELTGEVITTPFTFASTTQAIVRNGLTPVFCDIEPNFYTIDVNKLESLITNKTSAILPVHVYGNVCDYKAIERIAQKYNLKVIYDAAHAFGVDVDGIGIGNIGDAAMFSFHATKVFHTIEGGGLSYKDDSLKSKLDAWKMFGMEGKEDAERIGTNAKMTEFQAAMGLCNLRHLECEIAKRKAVVAKYSEMLSNVEGIKLCPVQDNVKSNYAYFPVYFDKGKFGKDRDEVIESLAEHNIFARKYFYPLTSSFSAYKGKFVIQETPVAEDVAMNILTLPLYADLILDDVEKICNIILER